MPLIPNFPLDPFPARNQPEIRPNPVSPLDAPALAIQEKVKNVLDFLEQDRKALPDFKIKLQEKLVNKLTKEKLTTTEQEIQNKLLGTIARIKNYSSNLFKAFWYSAELKKEKNALIALENAFVMLGQAKARMLYSEGIEKRIDVIDTFKRALEECKKDSTNLKNQENLQNSLKKLIQDPKHDWKADEFAKLILTLFRDSQIPKLTIYEALNQISPDFKDHLREQIKKKLQSNEFKDLANEFKDLVPQAFKEVKKPEAEGEVKVLNPQPPKPNPKLQKPFVNPGVLLSFPVKERIDEAPIDSPDLKFFSDGERVDQLGDRTKQMFSFLDGISARTQDKGALIIQGSSYKILTGQITDFNQPLVSMGSSPTREIIQFDPQKSPRINRHLAQIKLELDKKRMGRELSTKEALVYIKDYIRKHIFPPGQDNVDRVDAMCKQKLNEAGAVHVEYRESPFRRSSTKIPVIPLEEFVEKGVGVCRHHGLLTCYLMDQLTKGNNPILNGTVQHMRDNIEDGAHVWTVFIPKRKDVHTSREMWHLDTLWNVLGDYQKPEVREVLKKLYSDNAIDNQIKRTSDAAQKMHAVAKGHI